MLIQTLFFAALTFALAAAALLSAVVSARVAALGVASHYTDVALLDGVAQVGTSLRDAVARHGTLGPWPAGSSTTLPLCIGAAGPQCPLRYAYAWKVTGASRPGAAGGADTASHVQDLLNEQRLSVTLSVSVATRGGAELGTRTRLLTYRVLAAPPYAIVSGARDVTSLLGTAGAAEGDDSGAPAKASGARSDLPAPDPERPDRYRDSVINLIMSCRTIGPGHDSDPYAANRAPGNDGLPWGVGGAAFEAPCRPSYPLRNVPAGANLSRSGDYALGQPDATRTWSNGNEDTTAVPARE